MKVVIHKTFPMHNFPYVTLIASVVTEDKMNNFIMAWEAFDFTILNFIIDMYVDCIS